MPLLIKGVIIVVILLLLLFNQSINATINQIIPNSGLGGGGLLSVGGSISFFILQPLGEQE